MSKILVFCLLFCVNIFISLAEDESNEDEIYKTSDIYTAAVIEFNPPGSKFSNAEQKVEANLEEYVKLICEAKEHDVDILIFPEATLNYNDLSEDELRKFAIPLPSEVSNLEYENSCDDYTYNAILNDLSEAALNASIYVLVNVVEIAESEENLSNGNSFTLYNTNIVFNRQGCIISKYRKINLFIEPSMSVPEEPELASFDTDFGVTFGHFICFDILFKNPAYDLVLSNISHFLYPSMWFSEVPFLTSIQIQQNFAYRNNIVLLSAGANSPSNSKTGSGIFIGKYGAAEAFISCRNETKMIVAKIPKNIDDDSFTPGIPSIKPYTPIEMDNLKTWSFTPKNVHPLNEHFYYNDGSIECEFTVNYTKLTADIDDGENIGYTYKFAVFNGVRNCANIINVGEMYCAIIPCLSDDPHTCGQRFKNSEKLVPSIEFHSIKVNMKIHASDNDDYLVMPTSLDFSLHSLSVQGFEFSHAMTDDEFENYEIATTNGLSEILTFGIYGRNYSADYKNPRETEITVVSTTTEVEEPEETKIDRDSKMKKSLEDDDEYVAFKLAIYSGLMVVLCIIAAILVYRRLQHPYEHPLIIMRRKSEMNAS